MLTKAVQTSPKPDVQFTPEKSVTELSEPDGRKHSKDDTTQVLSGPEHEVLCTDANVQIAW
jgi:hypothetical protein